MSARQGQDDEGIKCPNCECRHCPVVKTKPWHNKTRMRQRVCRHCGRRFSTRERVMGTPDE